MDIIELNFTPKNVKKYAERLRDAHKEKKDASPRLKAMLSDIVTLIDVAVGVLKSEPEPTESADNKDKSNGKS